MGSGTALNFLQLVATEQLYYEIPDENPYETNSWDR